VTSKSQVNRCFSTSIQTDLFGVPCEVGGRLNQPLVRRYRWLFKGRCCSTGCDENKRRGFPAFNHGSKAKMRLSTNRWRSGTMDDSKRSIPFQNRLQRLNFVLENLFNPDCSKCQRPKKIKLPPAKSERLWTTNYKKERHPAAQGQADHSCFPFMAEFPRYRPPGGMGQIHEPSLRESKNSSGCIRFSATYSCLRPARHRVHLCCAIFRHHLAFHA